MRSPWGIVILRDPRGSEEVRGSGGVLPHVGSERAGLQESLGARPGAQS